MFMITWATVASTLIISIDKENFLMVKKIPRWLINVQNLIFFISFIKMITKIF